LRAQRRQRIGTSGQESDPWHLGSWSITHASAAECKVISDVIRLAHNVVDLPDDAIGLRPCVVDLPRYFRYGLRGTGRPVYPIIEEVKHVLFEVGSIISYMIYITLQAIAISRH